MIGVAISFENYYQQKMSFEDDYQRGVMKIFHPPDEGWTLKRQMYASPIKFKPQFKFIDSKSQPSSSYDSDIQPLCNDVVHHDKNSNSI